MDDRTIDNLPFNVNGQLFYFNGFWERTLLEKFKRIIINVTLNMILERKRYLQPDFDLFDTCCTKILRLLDFFMKEAPNSCKEIFHINWKNFK